MGLRSFVEGNAIVVGSSVNTRKAPVETHDSAGNVIDVQYKDITVRRSTNEWILLTQAAATGVVNDNEQPVYGEYSYSMGEDQRENGAYRLTREFTEEIEGPLVSLDTTAAPTFDPNGGVMSAYPFTVEIASTTSGAVIQYATLTDGVMSGWSKADSPVSLSISSAPTSEVIIYAEAKRAGMESSDMVASNAYTDDT